MKIIDISVDIYNGMPVFPGDPAPEIWQELSMPRDPFNVSMMRLGTHTGTHVDPPLHFVEGGYAVDRIPLDHLYGLASVVDLTHVKDVIRKENLAGKLHPLTLLKTRNSGLWKSPEFRKDYVYLDAEAAELVVKSRVKTLGIDYLSVSEMDAPEAVHKLLLSGGVTVVEGLNLSGVAPGMYTMACLPLKIRDGDGAPARAFLITGEL